jgi:hypothetical protein
VDVVPALNGRVVSFVHKPSGRQLLRGTDPGERRYPDVGGLNVTLHPDFHSESLDVEWKALADANELRFSGATSSGLRVRRTMRLGETGLETETVVENGTQRPLPAALHERVDFDPGNIDQASAVIDGRSRRLIPPGAVPNGSETLTGIQIPGGEWRISSGSQSSVHRFDKEDVERCVLSWTAKGSPRVTLGVWSKQVQLEPGREIMLRSRFGIR